MSAEIVEAVESRVTGRLAGRLAGHVQAPNLPCAAQVVSWMDLVDLCQELDESLVAAPAQSPEALALHQAVISLGIGCGDWLIHQIRTNATDISGSGHTLDVLEASLELLRILYRIRHPDLPPDEIETARRRIFNAAA